ncbi:MAG: SUMF1/EgtB/PvdO family nonheme iron enzyme [Anaerolineae bacterium]|nr:SUMF1/EgtB/PvdO family nonheme iron enzyme [Anaerolineae bacterium]
MAHIFISYSKQNKDYARKLADELRQEGFEIWIDDRIDYGDTWERAIFKAIDECLAFLVIMTPDSYASDWVLRECQYADKRKKPQFPVLLDGEEFPRYVSTQYADVRGGKLPGEDFLRRLEKFVGRKTAPEKSTAEAQSPSSDEGWIPKLDIPEARDGVTDAKVARFSKMHQEWLADHREQQVLHPPDVSHLLPAPFEWCSIPAGEVTVRFTPRAKAASTVPAFAIAKYPITNRQYQAFLDAQDGYPNPEWWGYSDAAKLWRREHKQARAVVFEGADLPRTNVSWYEAVSFCQWLTDQTRLNKGIPASFTGSFLITLPTEQQWQRAAQSEDGREYPWGNQFETTSSNTTESNIGAPTPVTQYPRGASPYGVMDMAGNVWEWCLSEWGTSEINLNSTSERVLRGGAWDNYAQEVTINRRIHNPPDTFGPEMGFRIVAVPVT